jgi:hypothetical protein
MLKYYAHVALRVPPPKKVLVAQYEEKMIFRVVSAKLFLSLSRFSLIPFFFFLGNFTFISSLHSQKQRNVARKAGLRCPSFPFYIGFIVHGFVLKNKALMRIF